MRFVWKFKATWSWTNWTFGLWYSKFGREHAFGIDVGPFECVWRRHRVKPFRAGGKV